MPAIKIKLISPSNEEIAGLLLEDGSICQVTFFYDKELLARDVILQEIPTSQPAKKDGTSIYLDVKGQHWSNLDVEYHSVLNS